MLSYDALYAALHIDGSALEDHYLDVLADTLQSEGSLEGRTTKDTYMSALIKAIPTIRTDEVQHDADVAASLDAIFESFIHEGDDDGKISGDVVVAAFSLFSSSTAIGTSIKGLLDLYDVDHSGGLEVPELTEFLLATMGLRNALLPREGDTTLSKVLLFKEAEAAAAKLMGEFDADGNGMIDPMEFELWLERTLEVNRQEAADECTYWEVSGPKGIKPRVSPTLPGVSVKDLKFFTGTVLEISAAVVKEIKSVPITFLKLRDGRGWVFDRTPKRPEQILMTKAADGMGVLSKAERDQLLKDRIAKGAVVDDDEKMTEEEAKMYELLSKSLSLEDSIAATDNGSGLKLLHAVQAAGVEWCDEIPPPELPRQRIACELALVAGAIPIPPPITEGPWPAENARCCSSFLSPPTPTITPHTTSRLHKNHATLSSLFSLSLSLSLSLSSISFSLSLSLHPTHSLSLSLSLSQQVAQYQKMQSTLEDIVSIATDCEMDSLLAIINAAKCFKKYDHDHSHTISASELMNLFSDMDRR